MLSKAMNTYRAVRTEIGDWTVEWAASGVVLGQVFGYFITEGEALLGAFEKSRAEFLGNIKRLREVRYPCSRTP